MYIVGLTGGIGSGKTAVAELFAARGVAPVDADIAARQVVEIGRPALARIRDHFGAGVLQADGGLDRTRLRELVFADPAERQWLEALLHPLIGEELRASLAEVDSPYALLVSPLLFETDQHRLCHRCLLVDAPEELQIQRTRARDGSNPEQVKAIMAAQLGRADRRDRADDIILNDRSPQDLVPEVDALHRNYLERAAAVEQRETRRAATQGAGGAP